MKAWIPPHRVALIDRIAAALAAPVSTGPLEDVHGVVAGEALGPLVTVPREPTEAMIAAVPFPTNVTPRLAVEVYRAMIAAAPPAGDDARDAARYRWLRGATWLVLKTDRIKWVQPDGSEFYSSHFLQANGMQCAAAPTLDETIDAAMRAQGESK